MTDDPRRYSIAEVTGALAAVAAFVYLSGALALQLRLGIEGLPSSAAVPQLPREFLIGIGLLLVAPAIFLAVLTGWGVRSHRPGARRTALSAGIGAGLLCYLVIGALVVFKDPFPAKVCLTGGREITGVFIGESAGRTYLGDLPAKRPRRVISIPQAEVVRVEVGGRPDQLDAIRCPR